MNTKRLNDVTGYKIVLAVHGHSQVGVSGVDVAGVYYGSRIQWCLYSYIEMNG